MVTATKASKKTQQSSIDYKIDSKLIDELYKVRIKLKTNLSYAQKVAGLCLLGEKDGIIDCFVPMISKIGCWDSPQISHAGFEKAFLKMIKKDRAVMGMALIRPDKYDASLPNDFRSNIREWKNAFKDILSTIWIVVSEKEVIPYSVQKDSMGRIQFRTRRDKLFTPTGDSKMLRIAEIRHKMTRLDVNDTREMRGHLEKLAKTIEKGTSGVQIMKNIEEENKIIDVRRKERLEKIKKQREEKKIKEQEARKLFSAQQAKLKKRKEQEKEGMKDTIDIGGGYFLIKGKDGKELLWKR